MTQDHALIHIQSDAEHGSRKNFFHFAFHVDGGFFSHG
jgi:hypothetical protein